MIKKTKTIEYNVIEAKDLEEWISELSGQNVQISDMNCIVYDCVPADTNIGDGFYFVISTENGEWDSFDLEEAGMLDGVDTDTTFLEEEYIFAFDTSMFKSYERYKDTSD